MDIGRHNTVKMSILPKVMYKHNSNQNPNRHFVETNKLILKLIGKSKGPRIAKIIWIKNTLPDFKIYFATVIKAV